MNTYVTRRIYSWIHPVAFWVSFSWRVGGTEVTRVRDIRGNWVRDIWSVVQLASWWYLEDSSSWHLGCHSVCDSRSWHLECHSAGELVVFRWLEFVTCGDMSLWHLESWWYLGDSSSWHLGDLSPHIWMSHIIQMNESCLTMSLSASSWHLGDLSAHIWMSHITDMNESRVTMNLSASHVPHVNASCYCQTYGWVLHCVAVCCSGLQCVAVYCSVLQCVAVRCSVLQCVAVCCSVRPRFEKPRSGRPRTERFPTTFLGARQADGL